MKKWVFAVCVSIMLTSCDYGSRYPCNPAYIPIDSTIIDYFGFMTVGSYWVYENQDKTIRDSVFVVSSRKLLSHDCLEEKEIFKIKLKSQHTYETHSNDWAILINDSRTLNTVHLGNIIIEHDMEFDFNQGMFNTDYSTNGSLRFLDKIQLNDTTYQEDVLEITNYNKDGKTYWKKNVGIVGFSLPSSDYPNKEDFNLIKHNIAE